MDSALISTNHFLSPYALPYLLTAAFMFFLGGFVFSHNWKSLTNLAYLFVSLSVSSWLLGNYLIVSSTEESTALFWGRFVYIGITLIPASMYFFSVAWLDQFQAKKQWVYVFYLAGGLLLPLFLFTDFFIIGVRRFYFGYFSKLSLWAILYLAYFFSVSLAFFLNLFKAYKDEVSSAKKAHIRQVLIAFVIAFIGAVDFWVSFGVPLYPIGFLTVLAFVLIVGHAIIHYKLMDIETVVHRTAMWLLTSGLVILPFICVAYWGMPYWKSLPPVPSLAMLFLFFFTFFFYYRFFQPWLDHLFQRRRANLERVLQEFSAELVHLKKMSMLLQRLSRLLRRTFYLNHLSIYLFDPKAQSYLPVMVKGFRGPKAYAPDHPFMAWLERKNQTVITKLASGDPELATSKAVVQQYLDEAGCVVAVPLVLGDKMIGFIHLGKKMNLRRYDASEIHFLEQLKAPVTIAVSNSRQLENISTLYDQVQQQNERLKELDQLKSEFLANTSHELRTPLHGILGLVESILDGADGPVNTKQAKHLAMILESGTSLKELINNLLELSRIEAGQAKLNLKSFNFINVVDAASGLLEGLAKKKGLVFKRQIPESLPDVFGDPDKVHRVLTNLIGNAIKFTHQGFVSLRVADQPDSIKVWVEDSGIGIPEKDLEHIFERFRQADGSTTRQYEGTGLGLSIAREIIRLHGSDIFVESAVGKGSVFSFELAKQAPDGSALSGLKTEKTLSAASHELAKSKESSQGAEKSEKEYELVQDEEFQNAVMGHGETILVIDDNPVNREVIRTRLELNQYQVVEAADGIDGFEKMEHTLPDLVILDLMMPRMSGYEFCRKLREKHSLNEVPVIMLTAKTEMGDKIYGLHLGANDYVAKPFNKEELIARVGVLLQIRQMTRELKKWNEELEQRVDERTRELAKTQEQLVQAEKLATIGTLAGGVAHEINNPLTAVLTNAQILKMGAKEDDVESLQLIEEGAKRCQIIVQKLLKYARKSSDMAPQKVDLSQVIKNACHLLEYQLAQDSIRVKMDFRHKANIRGISNELEQVFTNLIVNSRDAIKKIAAEGTIEIASVEQNGFVQVTVKDSGCGIAKEHLNKIFDPFFTTKDVGAGTGLGLAVSYSILEKHQCKVTVSSELNKGSVFTLYFPAQQES